jgi:hypothetical protein
MGQARRPEPRLSSGGPVWKSGSWGDLNVYPTPDKPNLQREVEAPC